MYMYQYVQCACTMYLYMYIHVHVQVHVHVHVPVHAVYRYMHQCTMTIQYISCGYVLSVKRLVATFRPCNVSRNL